MIKSKKLAIVTSVAIATFSGQSFAIVDGWDFSGDSARNEAMNADYWNSRDNYNVWVNPAYVTKYKNFADLNISDGVRDDEMAGVFKELGSSGTWGFYIGRPSEPGNVDINPSNFGFGFNQLTDFSATNSGATGAIPDRTPTIEEPRSQFDLFWAKSFGAIGEFGVRLNTQLLDGDSSASPATARTPNTFQLTDGAAQFNTVSVDQNSFSSSDINLSFGWVSNSGQFDAAFLIGMPSRSGDARLVDQLIDEGLNGVDGTVVSRQTTDFDGTEKVDDDGMQNLGFAIRGDFGGVLTAFSYSTRDRSLSSVVNGVTRFQDDTNADGTNETDTTTSFTQDGVSDGDSDELRLSASKVFPVSAGSNIFGSIGLVSQTGKTHSVNTQITNSVTDNLAGTTTYPVTGCGPNSNSANPCLGTQTNVIFEGETLTLPLVIAAEGKVSESFTVRGSISKNLYESIENETTTRGFALPTTADATDNTTATQQISVVTTKVDTSRAWDTDTTFSLGMGYKKDNFVVDLTLLKEFVTEGIDTPLTSRINATWMF
ncbi:MAG: hypothetical protein OQK98_11315 [Gammaproteobacteria bacterium]|nr:hypothetical protein [Gammaproteobacteria bacterium]